MWSTHVLLWFPDYYLIFLPAKFRNLSSQEIIAFYVQKEMEMKAKQPQLIMDSPKWQVCKC